MAFANVVFPDPVPPATPTTKGWCLSFALFK
jgi:hypothetical protein